MRVLSEYSIEARYAARTRVGFLVKIASGGSPGAAIVSNTEPSPTSLQLTSRGVGSQGAWLETRVISAITGRRCRDERSVRSNLDRVYWSGIVAQLKRGP